MSFLKFLFGRKKQEANNPRSQETGNDKGIEEHLDYLKTLTAPAIALRKTDGEVSSQIGGLPHLPEDMPWPEWNGKPLAFLCQVELREVPEGCTNMGLPGCGTLCFFYDQDQEVWGYDPRDQGGWRVLYTAQSVQDLPECPAPEGMEEYAKYPKKPVALVPIDTYPDWQDDRVNVLDMSDTQMDEYDEFRLTPFEIGPMHYLFGHPSPVQDVGMDLECQLVSNGLYCGDPSGYSDPRRKQLEAGRSDWILLFQLDSDDDAQMMWGDCGMLYFWIRKQDLAQARFDDCWMIFQCH